MTDASLLILSHLDVWLPIPLMDSQQWRYVSHYWFQLSIVVREQNYFTFTLRFLPFLQNKKKCQRLRICVFLYIIYELFA